MTINKLYSIAEKENIKIYDCSVNDCDGIFLNYDSLNAIALNYKTLNTSSAEKCTLSEELGHYFMDATYGLSSSFETKSRQEYRAKKWSFLTLVPYNKLMDAVNNGYTTLYELADYFNVTEDYMKKCLEFYNNKYGIN